MAARSSVKATNSDDEETGELKKLKGGGKAQDTSPSTNWRSAFAIAGPFVTDRSTRWQAWTLIAATTTALLFESGILLLFSQAQKNYMSALEEKEETKFHTGLKMSGVLIAVILPIIGFHVYAQGALETEWRASITRTLGQQYLVEGGPNGRGAFYSLAADGSLDNPEQRICQDVSFFTKNGISLMVDIAGSLMRLIGFIGLLYKISPTVCGVTFVYSTVSTLLAVYGFAPRIFKYENMITQQEATLRYNLIRVRENAESVAFFRGGAREWVHFQENFAVLVNTIYQRIYALCGFVMFTDAVKYFTFCVPVLLVGPLYMRGEVEFGEISQTQFAFSMIFDSLMLITNKIPDLALLGVQIERLHTLQQVLAKEASSGFSYGARGTTCIALEEGQQDASLMLDVSQMTLKTPARPGTRQQTIVQDLSLQLRSSSSLLIVGESGIGKSSLLRAISGLWCDGKGSVTRCGGNSVFFMPQKPYMCLGTLREQMLYPQLQQMPDSDLNEALQKVKLGYLSKRHGLDSVKDWANILSLGEQQRINFARALLQPHLELALLDEGTSACDPESEGHLYAALQQKLKSFVSVGHRPALRRYHTHVLVLEREKPQDNGSKDATGEVFSSPAKYSFLTMQEFQKSSTLDGCDFGRSQA